MSYFQLPFWDFFKKQSIFPDLFNKSDYFLDILISLLILLVIITFFILCYLLILRSIDNKKSKLKEADGILIDKKCFSDEKIFFFVKGANGINKIGVNIDQYYKYNSGDKITFYFKIGGITKEIIDIILKEN